jgi:hypothetical protein
MKKLALVFSITFTITFIAQAAYDWKGSVISKYIKTQIRYAKLINIVTKYNIKPEGLEG